MTPRPGNTITGATAALMGAGLVAVQIPFILTQHIQEDAYITFRCAVNLAATGVYGFNPGERVSASTSHVSVVVLGLLRWLSGDAFIRLAQLSYGAATVAGIYLLTSEVVDERRPQRYVWMIASVLPVSLLIAYGGMETGLVILMLGVITRATTRSTASMWCALAFVLLPWIRPDAIAIALIVLAVAARLGPAPRRVTAAYAALLVAGTMSWACFNRLYFGTWLTQTILGKAAVWLPAGPGDAIRNGLRTLAQLFFGEATVPGMFVPIQTKYFAWFSGPAFVIALSATAWVVARAHRLGVQRAPALVLGLIGFLIPPAYAFGGVVSPWYLWPSQLAVFLLLTVLCVEWVARHADTVKRVAVPTGVAVVALLAAGQWCFAVAWGTQERLYRGGIGEQIRSLSEPGDTLLLEPAGYVPFYARLWTWDEIGLASPSVTRYRLTHGKRWWIQFVKDVSPTFLLERESMRDFWTRDAYQLSADEQAWFTDHYRLVRVFTYQPSNLRRSSALRRLAELSTARDYLLYRRIR